VKVAAVTVVEAQPLFVDKAQRLYFNEQDKRNKEEEAREKAAAVVK
jgi:hypothetical protein